MGRCRFCGETRTTHLEGCESLACGGFDPLEVWPYDEGGNQLRHAMLRPCPEYDPKAEKTVIDFGKLEDWVEGLLGRKGKYKTVEQLHWLATLPYDDYKGNAYDIYKAIRAGGRTYGAMIPCDNEARAKRERKWRS
jgi:hypothetical protein